MAKPTHQDATLLLQLVQLHSTTGLSEAMNWVWSDHFILDYDNFIKKYPAGCYENIKVSKICGHFETIGTLWKHKLINEELLFDWFAIAMVWDSVKGFALGVRQESGEPRIYDNFEAMAKVATV